MSKGQDKMELQTQAQRFSLEEGLSCLLSALHHLLHEKERVEPGKGTNPNSDTEARMKMAWESAERRHIGVAECFTHKTRIQQDVTAEHKAGGSNGASVSSSASHRYEIGSAEAEGQMLHMRKVHMPMAQALTTRDTGLYECLLLQPHSE